MPAGPADAEQLAGAAHRVEPLRADAEPGREPGADSDSSGASRPRRSSCRGDASASTRERPAAPSTAQPPIASTSSSRASKRKLRRLRLMGREYGEGPPRASAATTIRRHPSGGSPRGRGVVGGRVGGVGGGGGGGGGLPADDLVVRGGRRAWSARPSPSGDPRARGWCSGADSRRSRSARPAGRGWSRRSAGDISRRTPSGVRRGRFRPGAIAFKRYNGSALREIRVAPHRTGTTRSMAPRSVRLSSAERVLFPDEGITKEDLFEYYRAIAPVLVRHLRNGPITMKRRRTAWPGTCTSRSRRRRGCPPGSRRARTAPTRAGRVAARRLPARQLTRGTALDGADELHRHERLVLARRQGAPPGLVLDLDPPISMNTVAASRSRSASPT